MGRPEVAAIAGHLNFYMIPLTTDEHISIQRDRVLSWGSSVLRSSCWKMNAFRDPVGVSRYLYPRSEGRLSRVWGILAGAPEVRGNAHETRENLETRSVILTREEAGAV